MLFNLQSDRFNKIIICPYIKKIKDVYDNTGFSKEFLKVIYANAGFFDDDETDQVFLVVSVTELSFILTLNEKLNGNKNNNTPRITDDSNAYFEVSSYIDKHNIACSTESMSFDILSAALTEKRMLKELDWIKKSVEFAFDILDKYSKPQKQSENLMDIIDGL